MKSISLSMILVSLLIATLSCNQETDELTLTKSPIKNYIVLLDLSDRLLQSGQSAQDIELTFSVFEKFEQGVRKNLVINSRDRFHVVIAPQKDVDYNRYRYEELLYIDMNAIPVNEKVSLLESFKADLKVTLQSLYLNAYQGDQPEAYNGSDIWRYFNEQLPYDLSDEAENYLIILTDGYFDFESYNGKKRVNNRYSSSIFLSQLRGNINWKQVVEENDLGMIAVDKEYPGIKACILEINPKYENLDEADMLAYFWSKWLTEMNITEFSTILHGSKPKCIGQLQNFFNSYEIH